MPEDGRRTPCFCAWFFAAAAPAHNQGVLRPSSAADACRLREQRILRRLRRLRMTVISFAARSRDRAIIYVIAFAITNAAAAASPPTIVVCIALFHGPAPV